MDRATVVFSHLKHGTNPGPAVLSGNPASGQRRHKGTKPGEGTKAVIFDMGGVLLPSPGPIFGGTLTFVFFYLGVLGCQAVENNCMTEPLFSNGSYS